MGMLVGVEFNFTIKPNAPKALIDFFKKLLIDDVEVLSVPEVLQGWTMLRHDTYIFSLLCGTEAGFEKWVTNKSQLREDGGIDVFTRAVIKRQSLTIYFDLFERLMKYITKRSDEEDIVCRWVDEESTTLHVAVLGSTGYVTPVELVKFFDDIDDAGYINTELLFEAFADEPEWKLERLRNRQDAR